MPTAKKATAKKTNGHRRNGVVPPERIEMLKEQYLKLKTDKARDQFLLNLTSSEVYYLSVSLIDPVLLKERLTMVGLI